MPHIWSISITEESPFKITPQCDIRVTNASLGPYIQDGLGRTTIRLDYSTGPPQNSKGGAGKTYNTTLGTLIPIRIEQCVLEIELFAGHEYVFSVVGKNTIFLTGVAGKASEARGTVSNDVSYDLAKKAHNPPIATQHPLVEVQHPYVTAQPPAEIQRPPVTAQRPPVAEQPSHNARFSAPASNSEESAISIQDFELGSGDLVVEDRSTVSVRYVGKIGHVNGEIFSSTRGTEVYSFTVGNSDVLRGLSEGVKGMRVGSKRRIFIPPSLGYGNDAPGSIPPNSSLVIDCKIKTITPPTPFSP